MTETEEQRNLRTRIREIQEDATKTAAEKMRCIQQLMSQPDTPSAGNCDTECTHYPMKKCSRFTFSCCNNIIDPCHRCHIARSCTAPVISTITCNLCDHVQPPSNKCVECSIEFSRNFCNRCNIWSNHNIKHCDDCGLCRVIPAEDAELFHCHTCNSCFPAETRDHHRCARVDFRELNCPLCLESIHDSQKETTITACGHVLHTDCLYDSVQSDNYRCPTCRKSLFDMSSRWRAMRLSIELQPLPHGFFPIRVGDIVESPYGLFCVTNRYPCIFNCRVMMCEGYFPCWDFPNGEFSKDVGMGILNESVLNNRRIKEIYCYDCEQSSVANFHYVGMECAYCYSFNTSS